MGFLRTFSSILFLLIAPLVGQADEFHAGLSELTVNVKGGGIGRQPINNDKISAILFYAASYPTPLAGTTAMSAGNPAVKCFSLQDVLNLGISSSDAVFKGLNYQAAQFFRINPVGYLWIGVYPVGSNTYVEIKNMQDIAQGEIRQMGVWSPSRAYTFLAADIAVIQPVIDTCSAAGFHMSVVFALNCSAVTTGWGTATDIRTGGTSNKISVIIAQDGAGAGAALATSLAYSVPMLGACLGCISKAAVNQSIGAPLLFNISDGTENESVALGNADKIPSQVSYTVLGNLKDKGYIVARKRSPRITGSFFERVPTCTPATDTYAWQEIIRAIDKAKRVVETTLAPQLQAALPVDSTGKLRADVVGFFQDLVIGALNNMKSANELSDFQVLIDPNQNVLSTSNLVITIKLIPIGTAEFITVNIGMVASF